MRTVSTHTYGVFYKDENTWRGPYGNSTYRKNYTQSAQGKALLREASDRLNRKTRFQPLYTNA